jgi:hypothetical protein
MPKRPITVAIPAVSFIVVPKASHILADNGLSKPFSKQDLDY